MQNPMMKNYKSAAAARNNVVNYIEVFYNSKRRHSALGRESPVDLKQKDSAN